MASNINDPGGKRLDAERGGPSTWNDLAGPFVRSDEVQTRLGLSRHAVIAKAAQRRLLRTITANGENLYPLWQFDGDHLVDGLVEVLTLFPEPSVDGWTVAAWLRTPDPELDQPPLDALARGERQNIQAVARAAARSLATSNRRIPDMVIPNNFDDPIPESELAAWEGGDVSRLPPDQAPISKREREQILGYDPETGA